MSYQVEKICLKCESHNSLEAVRCAHCGEIFTEDNVRFTTVMAAKTAVLVEQIQRSVRPSVDPSELEKNAVYFYIEGHEEPLVVRDVSEFVVGRQSHNTGTLVVDLQPYQAYILGVSRVHARISRNGNQVNVEDLGSANGTRVNGDLVASYRPRQISSGDQLQLGSMMIYVFYHMGQDNENGVHIRVTHPTATLVTPMLLSESLVPLLEALNSIHTEVMAAQGEIATPVGIESLKVGDGTDILSIEIQLSRGKTTVEAVIKALDLSRDSTVMASDILNANGLDSNLSSQHAARIATYLDKIAKNPLRIHLS